MSPVAARSGLACAPVGAEAFERPPADDPAEVARNIIRNTLTNFTAGRITVTEARHTISLALPLAQR